jgi:hypothetical protein
MTQHLRSLGEIQLPDELMDELKTLADETEMPVEEAFVHCAALFLESARQRREEGWGARRRWPGRAVRTATAAWSVAVSYAD